MKKQYSLKPIYTTTHQASVKVQPKVSLQFKALNRLCLNVRHPHATGTRHTQARLSPNHCSIDLSIHHKRSSLHLRTSGNLIWWWMNSPVAFPARQLVAQPLNIVLPRALSFPDFSRYVGPSGASWWAFSPPDSRLRGPVEMEMK